MPWFNKTLFKGLLIASAAGAQVSCTLIQKISGPNPAEIKNSLETGQCEDLQKYISNKIHPRDYLKLQYTLKCDLTFQYQLEHPEQYEGLLQDVAEKRALASPGIEDDQIIWLAKAQKATQKKEKEDFYLKVIETAPTSPLALEAQEALWALSPRLSPKKDSLDPLVLAADHRAAIENQKALGILQELFKKTKNENQKLMILEQKRQTLRSLQRKDDQLKVTEQIFQIRSRLFKKNPRTEASAFLESGLLYGRAVWTANRPSDARKILNEVSEKLPDGINQTELQWVIGKIEDEQRQPEQALVHFQKALTYPEGPFTLRTLWSAAWMDYKLGNFAEARKLFLDLAAKDPTENRARYWAARALLKIQPELKEEAQKEFMQILELDPLGYYGLLSQRELGLAFKPFKKSQQSLKKKALKKYLSNSQFLELKALVQVAEAPVLQGAVESVAKIVPASDTEAQYELSLLFAAGKLYLPLLIQIQKLDPAGRNALLKAHPELLFPVDYLDVIQPIAIKNKIPPEFALSIIRQESTFNTFARSPVDALGLMQMMPKLAEKKASVLKVSYTEPADLFKPEINIVYGIDELSELLQRYRGSYILASAGYNASPVAIRGWLEQRYREDVTEFIEEIGYDETRSYIKLVLRNFVFYKRLIQTESFPFPEELLVLKK